MTVIPGPHLYASAAEWLVGLEKYGTAIGAERMDHWGLAYIASRGEVRAFWDQIVEWGKQSPKPTAGATIRGALLDAWPFLTQRI